MAAVGPYLRKACSALGGKLFSYLTSASVKPLSPHLGFSPLRHILPYVTNFLRSPALMNVIRSPAGMLACLGCMLAMAALSFGQNQQHHSGNALNAPQLPVTSRVEGDPSRSRDVPLG